MAEVSLQRSCIVALVGQRKTTGVAQHMRMSSLIPFQTAARCIQFVGVQFAGFVVHVSLPGQSNSTATTTEYKEIIIATVTNGFPGT